MTENDSNYGKFNYLSKNFILYLRIGYLWRGSRDVSRLSFISSRYAQNQDTGNLIFELFKK